MTGRTHFVSFANEQANYESLRHFAGKYLSGKKGVLFLSQTMQRSSQVLLRDLVGFQIRQYRGFGPTMQLVNARSELLRNWLGRPM